jgi:diaminopimelate epimerase
MMYFNADGNEAELCGNGVRCAARYAVEMLGNSRSLVLSTRSGVIHCEVTEEDVILQIPSPGPTDDVTIEVPELGTITGGRLVVGVPHFVLECQDIESLDVERLGPLIRSHAAFGEQGTNVNFCEVESQALVRIRTFERGVEAETLACGTGAVAAAAYLELKERVVYPVTLRTRSGENLTVDCAPRELNEKMLVLIGSARFVYSGDLFPGALAVQAHTRSSKHV